MCIWVWRVCISACAPCAQNTTVAAQEELPLTDGQAAVVLVRLGGSRWTTVSFRFFICRAGMARGASRVVRIKWCGYGSAVDCKVCSQMLQHPTPPPPRSFPFSWSWICTVRGAVP